MMVAVLPANSPSSGIRGRGKGRDPGLPIVSRLDLPAVMRMRWWALLLPAALSACASDGKLQSPYARTPTLAQSVATTPQEVIEQELEPGEIQHFRRFLAQLPPVHRQALISVLSQMDEGQSGLTVVTHILPDPVFGQALADLSYRIGPGGAARFGKSFDERHLYRWDALKEAFDSGVDLNLMAGIIRSPRKGASCASDVVQSGELINEESEARCEEIALNDEPALTFSSNWNRAVVRMILAQRAYDAAPYQVQLMRAGKDREYYHQPKRTRYEMERYGRRLEDYERDHVCGAVYIGEDYALTAAHCLEGWRGYDGEFFEGRRIRAGTSDISRGGEVIPIKSVVIHESYKEGKAYAGYDIALLKLARAPNNPLISRTDLPKFPRNRLNSGTTLVQTGWGLTGATDNSQLARDLKGNLQQASDALLMGEMQLYDNARCDNNPAFKDKKVKVRYGQICVGSDEGVDACRGDSGGPLVLKRTGQLPVLIGIVSWGIGCGIEGRPAIYTDTGTFYTWILLAKSAARDGKIVYIK